MLTDLIVIYHSREFHTKKDQAKIIWSEAKRMVKKSPVLSKRIRTLVADMISDFNDGSFKPLSSDSNTLDGLNLHASLIDKNLSPMLEIA